MTSTPKRRWLRFSLRTLLLAMLVLGAGLGWFAKKLKEAREQQAAVQAIEKLGGYAAYSENLYYEQFGYWLPANQQPRWGQQPWWEKLLGIDFRSIRYIRFSPQTADDDLTILKGLKYIRELYLSKTLVTDAGLEHLKGLSQLHSLYLTGTPITDAGLVKFAGLKQINTLDLGATQITDVGLAQLSGLKQLRVLHIQDTQIADDGIKHLVELKQLKELWLTDEQITDVGIEKLKESLPNLKIKWRRAEWHQLSV